MIRSNTHSLLSFIAIVLLTLVGTSPSTLAQQTDVSTQAQQDDQKLLNGLRERRLFGLADDYCQQLLDSNDLPPQRRVTLVVHQLKNLTAKAASASSESRQEIRQQTDKISNDFVSSFQGSRGFLVRAQQSLATIAQAELIRQEIDAHLAQPGAAQDAISLLRSVRDELENTIGDIGKSIPQAKPDPTPTDLSVPQLLALKANLQFRFAICNLERSQLYQADDKASRKDALNQAREQIAGANRSTEKGKALWWEAKFASSKCDRLLGRLQEANITLQALPTKLLPNNLKPRLRIERLQVALASKNPTQVGTLVRQALQQSQRPPIEDIGLVQATAWLARTTNPDQAVRWKSTSASLVKSVKASHGRYWGRRAELLLVGSIQDNAANNPAITSVSPDADLLILTEVAETALTEQRYQDAIKGFDEAILLARQQSDYESVLRLSIQQGRLFGKLGQHAKAADVMINTAIVKPNLRNAAEAHLLGCWNLSRTITGPESQQRAKSFQERLEQHLKTWPTSATTESALLWLGEQHQQNRNYRAALETFLRVSTDGKRFPRALTQAADAASNILLSLEQSEKQLDTTISSLLSQLREPATKNPALEPITELLAADINIRFRSRLPKPETVNAFAQDQLISDSNLTELRFAIDTISKIKDTAAFEKQLSQTENKPQLQQRLHGYLNGMRTRDDSSNSAQTLAAANLKIAQQAVVDAQATNQTGPATVWKLRIVDLQQSLNQHESAIATLTELVKEFPRKADLQIKLAEAMTQAFSRSDPQKAINQWRILASKLRPGTDNWFLAKYNAAKLLHRSGKRDDALKLLKYIKANPPGWDNSKLKTDFDSLFEKLN